MYTCPTSWTIRTKSQDALDFEVIVNFDALDVKRNIKLESEMSRVHSLKTQTEAWLEHFKQPPLSLE